MRESPNERFDSRVELIPFSTCWYWVGSLTRGGYGRIEVHGKSIRAHRYSYARYVGAIPDGLQVLHKCDTPACVNPDHLEVGTHIENHRQKAERGRAPRGEAHGNAKLTDTQVAEVRIAVGSQKSIGDRFGISKTHVRNLKRGVQRRHL